MTSWKVTDLFWGRGDHRFTSCSHPGTSTRSTRVSTAHSHLCQLQRDTDDTSPASPTAGLGSVNYFHLISSRSSAYPLPGPPPPPASPRCSPVRVLWSWRMRRGVVVLFPCFQRVTRTTHTHTHTHRMIIGQGNGIAYPFKELASRAEPSGWAPVGS